MALLRQGLPTNFVTPRGDDVMIDRVDYDGLTDRIITERIMVRNGRVNRAKYFSTDLQSERIHVTAAGGGLPLGRDIRPGRRTVLVVRQARDRGGDRLSVERLKPISQRT